MKDKLKSLSAIDFLLFDVREHCPIGTWKYAAFILSLANKFEKWPRLPNHVMILYLLSSSNETMMSTIE